MKNKNLFVLLGLCLLLSACESFPDWLGGDDDEKKLPGTRISVIEDTYSVAIDKSIAGKPISLPKPEENNYFADEGYQTVQNPTLPEKFSAETIVSEADESPKSFRIASAPVIAEGKVFYIDGKGVVYAHDAGNIKNILWRNKSLSKTDYLSGGLAYDEGKIFVTTLTGDVLCLSANDGSELWRRKINMPIKSTPIAKDGKVLFITADNELYVLASDGGRTLWNHSGIATNVGIIGAATPIIVKELAIVPYSSGELYGIRADSGKILWSESLTGKVSSDSTAFALADIDADPVSDGENVYAGSNQALFAAKDLATGKNIWQEEISILKTPWLAGDYIFLINTDYQVMAVEKETGKVKWITPLEDKEKAVKKNERTSFEGPILAGGRLLVIGSNGELVSISPDDGKIIERKPVISKVYLRPAVANGTLYLLNNEGKLASYR